MRSSARSSPTRHSPARGRASSRARTPAGSPRTTCRAGSAPHLTPASPGRCRRRSFARLTPDERHLACAFDNVCSCVRMSVWRAHPFPGVPFAEDVEWARDVLLAGHRIAFVPDAVVRHSHDRSVSYELRRTYLAHQRLHALFGLTTIPTAGALVRSVGRRWLCISGWPRASAPGAAGRSRAARPRRRHAARAIPRRPRRPRAAASCSRSGASDARPSGRPRLSPASRRRHRDLHARSGGQPLGRCRTSACSC